MTEIYLIRHGETAWNIDHRFQGKTNIQLTSKGIAEAGLLGNRLADTPFEVIYTSPLDRAKQTAEIIADYQKTPVSILNPFCEVSFGKWEGYTFEEIREFTPWLDQWYKDPGAYTIPEGDDLVAEVANLEREMIALAKKHEGQKIAIVAHAGILRLALLCSLKLPLTYYWRFVLSNTSFTVIQYAENVFNLAVLNDYSHLSNR